MIIIEATNCQSMANTLPKARQMPQFIDGFDELFVFADGVQTIGTNHN